MIFIFNTTGKQLVLKSVDKEDRVVLNIVNTEMEISHPLCHVNKKENAELAEKVLESYKEGVEIKSSLTKKSITLENNICFYEPATNKFYNVSTGENFSREQYKTSPRNMIVVVTSNGGTVDVYENNIVGTKTKYSFKQEISIHQLYLKWNDWHKLKNPVDIFVYDNGDITKVSTSTVRDKTKDGREFNRNMLKKFKIDATTDNSEKESGRKPYRKDQKGSGNNKQGQKKYTPSGDKKPYNKNSDGHQKNNNNNGGGYKKSSRPNNRYNKNKNGR